MAIGLKDLKKISPENSNGENHYEKKTNIITEQDWLESSESLLEFIISEKEKKHDNQGKDRCLRPWESFGYLKQGSYIKEKITKDYNEIISEISNDDQVRLARKIKERAEELFSDLKID